jgi:metallo-beta-lactamase family protein
VLDVLQCRPEEVRMAARAKARAKAKARRTPAATPRTRRVLPAAAATAPTLRFLGAAGTVTGSRFLIDTPRARVLVDCGLFQGLKELRLRNWEPFPVEPRSLHAVLVTHAHLDHSGYLPALVRQGFRGPIYCTANTDALCRIVLPDAASIQEEDAAYANRKGFSKHEPALPLYTGEDAARALRQLRVAPFDVEQEVAPGVRVTFRRAGHILGSAWLRIVFDDGETDAVLVSGDLGRPYHPILCPPAPPEPCGTLLLESTYGGRRHDEGGAEERLAQAIVRTAQRRGAVVIPAFAVDRTEVLLLTLRRLEAAGRIPHLPVYVDSPMALASLHVYERAAVAGDPEIRPELRRHDPFDPRDLVEAREVAESKAIHEAGLPCIIVSASGMATGGRVLHHLKAFAPDPRNMIVLPGFQAAGTRGAALANGADEIKVHGEYVPVRAEVVKMDSMSAHADYAEILDWLRGFRRAPRHTFVTHGEPAAADEMRRRIAETFGWKVSVPDYGEAVTLAP